MRYLKTNGPPMEQLTTDKGDYIGPSWVNSGSKIRKNLKDRL